MNKIDEIALRVAVQHGLGRNGERCFDDSELIDFAHALLAELSKDVEPFGYYENGRWSVNVDGGPDKYRERKKYAGPIFTRPAMPDQSEIDSLRKDAERWRMIVELHNTDQKEGLVFAWYDVHSERRINGLSGRNPVAIIDAAMLESKS